MRSAIIEKKRSNMKKVEIMVQPVVPNNFKLITASELKELSFLIHLPIRLAVYLAEKPIKIKKMIEKKEPPILKQYGIDIIPKPTIEIL